MNILSVAYPLAPVSRDAVGGAEQVLAAIDCALVAAGHRSIVVARGDSRIAGELRAILTSGTGAAAQRATAQAIAGAMAEADLIHLHGIDFTTYLPPAGKPVLVTLHLPPDWYDDAARHPVRPDTWLHCVSPSQHARCGALPALLPPIENGVDVAALGAVRHARRGFALMLGRVCPEKGQALALQAARDAGRALLLGGAVFPYPAHQAYFAESVVPLLDAHRRFLGPLDFARKRRLLAAACCLLVPSLAAETSSLVAMEALACGTPVIAFRAGALQDIVAHGRTGFLVDDAAGMTRAMRDCGDIDPAACREAAHARFSSHRMTASYLNLYRRLLACAAT